MNPNLMAVIVAPILGLANLLLKKRFGADFNFAGADLALGGASLLWSWLARAILRGNFPLGGEGLFHAGSCLVALLFWIGCLVLAAKRTIGSLVLTGLIGASILILSVNHVYHLTERGF